jgi:hypothetical protein
MGPDTMLTTEDSVFGMLGNPVRAVKRYSPSLSMNRSLSVKLATPDDAFNDARTSGAEEDPFETKTSNVIVDAYPVAVLPPASQTSTTGCSKKGMPPVLCEGCLTKCRVAAGPGLITNVALRQDASIELELKLARKA